MPVIPIYGEDITTTSGSTRSVRDEGKQKITAFFLNMDSLLLLLLLLFVIFYSVVISSL